MANLRADNLTGTGGRNAIDGSVYFDGSSYLICSTSSDFELPGDFTIEMWWKNAGGSINNGTGSNCLFDTKASNSTAGMECFIGTGGTLSLYGGSSGSTSIAGAGAVGLFHGTWNHIAITRSSNVHRVFVNGIVGASSNSDSTYYISQTNRPVIGSDGSTLGTNTAKGYISNFRIVKGTALYTANFIPPTEKLTAIDGTILLCCQDSDDPTQEATGKTITAYGNLDYSLRKSNLITNGNFRVSATDGWTVASGSAALGTGQSSTFGDGNHLVMTGGNMYQAFTTVIGRTYFVNAQSNGGDSSYISTSASAGDAIITDIRSDPQTGSGVRGQKSFVATQTTYYVILAGGGTGNFDTVSVYEAESHKPPKVLPPVGIDEGVTFKGDTKVNTQSYMYFPTGRTEERGGYSGRMIVGGGEVNASPGVTNVIEYFNFAHFSNGVGFGELTQARRKVASCSSSTRGIWAGGGSPGSTDRIDYVTIATKGDAIDFANLFTGVSDDSSQCFGGSNNTRGIFAGGYNNVDTIQYITIATTSDAQDFGDLITGRFDHAGFTSPTRAVFAGGKNTPASPDTLSSIEYVTIATTGGGTEFGDMTAAVRGPAGLSNNIRGLMGGGSPGTNSIEYVTIATTGNAADFGDLFVAHQEILAGGSSNNTRGVWAGGQNPAQSGMLQSVMIASMGNAIDWSNLTTGTSGAGSVSDSHGGLS